MEKDNPDLYKKLFEPKPKTIVEALTAEVAEKLNLAGDESAGLNAASGAAAAADEADESIGEDGEKKHQSRGGKGLVRDESAKLDKEAQKRAVQISLILVSVVFTNPFLSFLVLEG